MAIIDKIRSLFGGTSTDYVLKDNSGTQSSHLHTKAQVGLGNVDNTSDADKPISTATQTALNGKVDKVSGKGLSTNDYTTTEKNKLDGIETGANKTVVDSALSGTSTNPVQNKVVKAALDGKAGLDTDNVFKGTNTFENDIIEKRGAGYNVYFKRRWDILNYGSAYNNWPQEQKDGAHFREWALRFEANTNFWGRLQITLISSFSSANASGLMRKSINVAFNGSSPHNNQGSYDKLGVNTENEFRISDIVHNDTLGCNEIRIHSVIPSSNNVAIIGIEAWVPNSDYISVIKSMTITNMPYITTDTSYTKLGGGTVSWATKPVFQTPYGNEVFDLSKTLPIANGGTGATTAAAARTNLGLGNVENESVSDGTPDFTEATTRTNIASGEKMSTLFGKIKKWFTDLKALAFKDNVSDGDINGKISDSHISSASTWNGKLNADGSNGTAATTGNLIRKLGIWTEISASSEYVPSANSSDGQGRYSLATILSWIKDNISPLAKTLKINAPSGGSAYFEIERTDSGQNDTGFRVSRTAAGSNDIEFSIGAGGENRGFYDNNGIGGWAVWLDSSDNLNLMPTDSNASSGHFTIPKGSSSTHSPLINYLMNHDSSSNDPQLGVFASTSRHYGVQLDADRPNGKFGVYAYPTNSSSGHWLGYVDSNNMASLGGASDTQVRLGNTVVQTSQLANPELDGYIYASGNGSSITWDFYKPGSTSAAESGTASSASNFLSKAAPRSCNIVWNVTSDIYLNFLTLSTYSTLIGKRFNITFRSSDGTLRSIIFRGDSSNAGRVRAYNTPWSTSNDHVFTADGQRTFKVGSKADYTLSFAVMPTVTVSGNTYGAFVVYNKDVVPYLGNIRNIGSNSPAANAIAYWTNAIPALSVNMAYNNSGSEYTFIFSKGDNNNYGNILRFGYNSRRIEILRNENGWKSSDWEGIDADSVNNIHFKMGLPTVNDPSDTIGFI